MNSACDICNNVGTNYSVCPDGSDQQPQFCHLKPPEENCTILIDDCNTELGICIAKGGETGPAPGPSPTPAPTPAVLTDQNQNTSQSEVSKEKKAALSVVSSSHSRSLVAGVLIWGAVGLAGLFV